MVEAHVRDSTTLLLEDNTNMSDGSKSPVFNERMFDRILLDAPCSAVGQRPQFNISMKPKELASFPKLQKKLFDVAYKLLKPGGVLMYSTCTFTIEENEGLVQWAMDKYFHDLIYYTSCTIMIIMCNCMLFNLLFPTAHQNSHHII